MSKYDNFKFRASGLGNIVTKSGKLTQGAMTYIVDCFTEAETGVRKDAFGKALEKGIATEQDIIQLINDAIYPGQFVARVTESKENEYIKGTADVIHENIVYDCKSAFDEFTFGKAELSWIYEWQLRAYMWLYGKTQARLFYGLVDMPEYMIYDEQKKLFYKGAKWLTMEDPEFVILAEELESKRKYGQIDILERCKVWHIEQSDTDIERIQDAVSDARAYMNQLHKDKGEMINYIKSIRRAPNA